MKKIIYDFIGFDVGSSYIKMHCFNDQHLCHKRNLTVDSYLTPGAITVLLCEAIDLLDDGAVNSIVVIIPGVIDKTGRFVESWIGNPLWVDIPLADWLEIRLKIKVVLAGKNSFSFIKDLSVFSYHLKNSFSLFYQSSSS